MAHKYTELQARMSPECRALSQAMSRILGLEMNLAVLRDSLDVCHEDFEHALATRHPELVELDDPEACFDPALLTLRAYIKALGGELEVLVRFPTGVVSISDKPAGLEPEQAHHQPAPMPPDRLSVRPHRKRDKKAPGSSVSLSECDRRSTLSVPVKSK